MHELPVGLLNTISVTLEKIMEVVVRSGMIGLFFLCPKSEQHWKLLTFGFFSARRLILRLELREGAHLPTWRSESRQGPIVQ